jgi:hypothetical protein
VQNLRFEPKVSFFWLMMTDDQSHTIQPSLADKANELFEKLIAWYAQKAARDVGERGEDTRAPVR